ncbi:MAG: dUTP diphosphatase [Bulleidia sp.]|nr:dUTP diphosphatase [Bulleidia sp.]
MTAVYFEKLNEDVKVPFYASAGDAGMDVCADEDVIIAPGETALVKTGLKLAIPEGYEVQVRPRSGLSLKTPLRLCNAPGTIDSGYRGELCIILQNTSKDYQWVNDQIARMRDIPENHHSLREKWTSGYCDIHKGDRIAQMVLCRVEKADLQPVDSVENIGTDRGGGFGHSGV